MSFPIIFGIVVIAMGMSLTIINIITMIKINNRDVCKEDETLKNCNTGSLVIGIILSVIGVIFFIYGQNKGHEETPFE